MTRSSINLHAPYQTRVDSALNNRHLRAAVNRTVTNISNNRIKAMDAVDGDALRDQLRQVKEYTLRHLPQLLMQLEEKITENGGHVHWANDGPEAIRIAQNLAAKNGVRKVVKSKSMVSEEIHLNAALEAIGVRPIETDLGEYIIQLDNEPPSHILAPVIHKRMEDISKVFQRELDIPPTLDPEVMCSAARAELRKEFLSAEMGISGCNFAIAETGQICIVTNEGNGRMVSSMPSIYVVIMGIEKLVPTVEDAFLQYQVLCRSATGQQASVYMSMTGGPSSQDAVDGPTQFHVILLDNGRTDLLANGYGEGLMCIRCGACLNVCPVYREIGGHAYGSTYSGPIGAVISPLLNNPVTDAHKLPHASTLCGACRDACPVKIDLPKLLLDLRADGVDQGAAPAFERQAIKRFVRSMSSRSRYVNAGRMARLGTSILSGLNGGTIKFGPPPLSQWTESRTLPPFAPKSFRVLWRQRQQQQTRVPSVVMHQLSGNPNRASTQPQMQPSVGSPEHSSEHTPGDSPGNSPGPFDEESSAES